MIDIRKLKELVRLMVANDLTELDLRDSEEQVTLRRPGPALAAPAAAPSPQPAAAVPAAVPAAPVSAPASAPAAETSAADDTAGLIAIESPMVGTFYSAADPESPPFVKVGDQVTPETNVCLLEAMKIFNEIKAETSGTVRKICVKNGDAVEFGQPMFYIQPG